MEGTGCASIDCTEYDSFDLTRKCLSSFVRRAMQNAAQKAIQNWCWLPSTGINIFFRSITRPSRTASTRMKPQLEV